MSWTRSGKRIWFSVTLLTLFVAAAPRIAAADDAKLTALGNAYKTEILPLVSRYCFECHSAKKMEADVDLTLFTGLNEIRQHAQIWQKAGEMLDSGQMPPREARQPTAAEQTRLRKWVRDYLTYEANARSGDPGRVVLRRLSNSEYTYTMRDLTGIATLEPAREFPVDGAAGEGFTNTGNALVMSPALVTKYLDAAKQITQHAVLLPDGIRFSASDTPSDWTNEVLARIRDVYRTHADSGGASKVNLQGIVFETNDGGRLAIEKYLAATLIEREPLEAKRKTIETVARERGLNAKYLGILWQALHDPGPSLVLDRIRAHWRSAGPEQAEALSAEVGLWQKGLWRFSSVGHIGKVGGPKGWQEPVIPLTARHEIRFKLPATDQKEVVLYLVALDAGDGNEHDHAVWEQPRIVAPGRPDLLLRDVRDVYQQLVARRQRVFASVASCLAVAAEASAAEAPPELAALARKANVEPELLGAWLDYLGIGTGGAVTVQSHFKDKFTNPTYDFVRGWGPPATPNVAANSSDQHVRVPGNMKPHSIAMHPSPALNVVAGWRSPVAGRFRVEAQVQHAHPECGNGVTWSLEIRRGNTRQRLATGVAQGAKEVTVGPIDNLPVKPGDLVSLVIGPRDGNHSCDTTAVDLTLSAGDRKWNLAHDVSPSIQAANPHADSFGNEGVWHFYTEPVTADVGPVIPADSLVAKWQSAQAEEKSRLAAEIQKLLIDGPLPATTAPDGALYRQLASLNGPLFGPFLRTGAQPATPPADPAAGEASEAKKFAATIGLDRSLFGKHPDGSEIDAASLGVKAPSVIEVRLPADLVAGCELVTTGRLDPKGGPDGSVQLLCQTTKPDGSPGLLPPAVAEAAAKGSWTSNTRGVNYGTPIIVNDGSAARKRIETAMEDFRQLFPAALCYTKIVPVDEVVTLTLFHREDHHLARLMLDEREQRELDELWDELHYLSRDALTLVDAYAQLMEYATQDADPKVFEPLRQPINDRAAAFRKRLVDTQPAHVAAILQFAARAYRRPLTEAESAQLRGLYDRLRGESIPHEEAIRLTLARVLVAPAFLYRVERPSQPSGQAPVSDYELASRLSYFLWSSQPDDALTQLAAAGRLNEPELLVSETKRMLRDPRARRLAIEFGCQWLHIRDFDQLDEKSDRHFPTFAGLRNAMYEESILFLTDLFQNNGPVTGLLDADHTFLNEDLARHYGIPGVTGPQWRRVDGIRKYGRGGILAHATTLATQSGASRTSPILRGNWISEVLLGERLPRPPKGIPLLPEDETATDGLTVRELVERHSIDPKCIFCHERIDPFGFSLEGFDAIGRLRDKDLAGRPIATSVKVMDGAEFTGVDGLRNYLLTARRDAFVRQFCRKLLGYSLGRGVQLSDEPLLAEMQAELKAKDYRVVAAIEAIVKSRQFREIRGREHESDE